jgi:hypothetical protein
MNEIDPRHVRRQRRVLIALALLFFAPLGAAFYLYYGLDWHPGERVNRGNLVNPPQPLPALALPRANAGGAEAGDATRPDFLKRKWTFLYWGPGSCSTLCRADLYNTRQVRLALGREMDRAQRVFLAEGALSDPEFFRAQHPDLIIVRATPEAASLLAVLRESAGGGGDRVYLIDPLGNLMMWYAPDAKPKGMLEDIKRLLGLSQVG